MANERLRRLNERAEQIKLLPLIRDSYPNHFTSDGLLEALNELSPGTQENLKAGVRWLDSIPDIRFVMIGGGAVVSYLPKNDSRPISPDFDFVTRDLPKIWSVAKEQGFTVRALKDNLGIHINEYDIDIVDSKNDPIIDGALAHSQTHSIAGCSIRVAQPEMLFLIKFLIQQRDKDENDMFLLLKSGVLYRDNTVKLIEQYKNDMSPENYEQLMTWTQNKQWFR